MDAFTGTLLSIFAFDGLLIAGLAALYYLPRFGHLRLSPRPAVKAPVSQRLRVGATIGALSLVFVLGPLFAAPRVFLDGESAGGWVVAGQALAILVVYDFAYYAFHRTLHVKRLMRFAHGVHHRARNPSAFESFYMHPLELAGGLGLLFAATWLVGPVHPAAFLAAFFVYSTMNIVIHAGVRLPGGLLVAPVNFFIRKHHVHHQDDFGKNFSSLTPLPDVVFGTAG